MSFRLTYATMFDPPAELHERFDAALRRVAPGSASGTSCTWHGVDTRGRPLRRAPQPDRPRDRRWASSRWRRPTDADAGDGAARTRPSRPGAQRRWPSALRMLRRVADVMEARVYDIAAALTLEVGKNRMEALGEAQETVDFFRHYADDFERQRASTTRCRTIRCRTSSRATAASCGRTASGSVIAPFNFPLALAGGPTAAALVTGNTVVRQGRHRHAVGRPPAGRLHPRRRPAARRVPLPVRLGARGRRGAGGASGDGRHHLHRLGRRSARNCCSRWPPGRGRARASPRWAARIPASSPRDADLDDAAAGIVRSAYGMGGQKCSALSRLYVDATRRRRADRATARADRRDPDRRSRPARALARPGDQRRRRREPRALRAPNCGRAAPRSSPAVASCATATLARGHYVDPVLAEAPLDAPAVAARDVPADPDAAPGGRPRRGDAARQRQRTWA